MATVRRRRPGRGSITDAQLAEEESECYRMRLEGATLSEIANRMGFSVSTAYNRVKKRIEQNVVPLAEEVRKMELDRLDMMWQWNLPGMKRGNHQALAVGLKILERRAKYISGLEVPQQIDAMIHDMTPQDLELRELLNEAAAKEAADKTNAAQAREDYQMRLAGAGYGAKARGATGRPHRGGAKTGD